MSLMPGRSGITCVMLLASFILTSCGDRPAEPPAAAGNGGDMLVLYTALPAERMSRLAERYLEDTGVLVNYMVESDDVLIDKLVRKEHRPGADVLLISGASHLADAVDTDVLRPISAQPLENAVAETLRDPDGYWFGVGHRAEVLAYDARSVQAESLGGYAGLAGDEWRGRLCLQRGSSERMRSIVAALIASMGERDAELVVRGWRANLATSVFDDQQELLQAIEDGTCAVGIVGSDQVAGLVQRGAAANTRVHFPPADAGGTLQETIAAGVARHANDAALATAFVEWLVSADGQAALHEGGTDYPLAGNMPAPLDAWPDYSPSPVDAARAGYLRNEAQLLIERARYR